MLATVPRMVSVSEARGAKGSNVSTSTLMGDAASSAMPMIVGLAESGIAVAGAATAPHHASATVATKASGARPITRCRLRSFRGAS